MKRILIVGTGLLVLSFSIVYIFRGLEPERQTQSKIADSQPQAVDSNLDAESDDSQLPISAKKIQTFIEKKDEFFIKEATINEKILAVDQHLKELKFPEESSRIESSAQSENKTKISKLRQQVRSLETQN